VAWRSVQIGENILFQADENLASLAARADVDLVRAVVFQDVAHQVGVEGAAESLFRGDDDDGGLAGFLAVLQEGWLISSGPMWA